MVLVPLVGAWLYRTRRLETARWFLWTAVVGDRVAVRRRDSPAGCSPRSGVSRGSSRACCGPPTPNSPSARAPRRSASAWACSSRSTSGSASSTSCSCAATRASTRPSSATTRRTAAQPAMSYCDGSRDLWFCLIAVLWAGYFVLEGFDFGVGMLLPFLARDERERSAMFETIGPVWDGNEVWLVVAGGATFAAFPAWYATMFSGFYLALLLVLVCLIVRVVSFEWREQAATARAGARRGVGQHGRQRRGAAHLGDRAGQPPARRAARLGRRVRRRFRRPVQRLHGARRASRRCCCSRSTARRSSRCAPAASCASARPQPHGGSPLPVAVVAAAFLVWTVAVAHRPQDSAGCCRSAVPAAIGDRRAPDGAWCSSRAAEACRHSR